jgi:hypothetical protein
VNAAFLLVTTAWFAGADAAQTKPAEKPAPPVATSPAVATSCGTDCGGDCGCESGFQGFLSRLRAHFHRNDCCDSCGAAPACKPAPASACGSCDTGGCCESFGHRLREKLHGLFHRDSCDTCDSCGSGGGGAMPKVESLPPPKTKTSDPGQKLPVGAEPSYKPAGLEKAPTVVPNVTTETEKSPY